MVVRAHDHPSSGSGRKLDRFWDFEARIVLAGRPGTLSILRRGPRPEQAWTRTNTENPLQPRPLNNQNRLVSPMRELERDDLPSPLSATALVVFGRCRVGSSPWISA